MITTVIRMREGREWRKMNAGTKAFLGRTLSVLVVVAVIAGMIPSMNAYAAPAAQSGECKYDVTTNDVAGGWVNTTAIVEKTGTDLMTLITRNGASGTWNSSTVLHYPCGGNTSLAPTATPNSISPGSLGQNLSQWGSSLGQSNSSSDSSTSTTTDPFAASGSTSSSGGAVSTATPEPVKCVDPVSGQERADGTRLCYLKKEGFRASLEEIEQSSGVGILGLTNPKAFAVLIIAGYGAAVVWQGSMQGRLMTADTVRARAAAWTLRANVRPVPTAVPQECSNCWTAFWAAREIGVDAGQCDKNAKILVLNTFSLAKSYDPISLYVYYKTLSSTACLLCAFTATFDGIGQFVFSAPF